MDYTFVGKVWGYQDDLGILSEQGIFPDSEISFTFRIDTEFKYNCVAYTGDYTYFGQYVEGESEWSYNFNVEYVSGSFDRIYLGNLQGQNRWYDGTPLIDIYTEYGYSIFLTEQPYEFFDWEPGENQNLRFAFWFNSAEVHSELTLVSVTPVPETTTMLLLGIGILCIAGVGLERR
jgi:hypothetical protein